MSLFPSESGMSAAATDCSSNIASSSSTPPTSISDIASQASDGPKLDDVPVILESEAQIETHTRIETRIEAQIEAHIEIPDAIAAESARETPPEPQSEGRPRRSCSGKQTYNLSQLSGTANRGKRRAKGDDVADRRRTISGATPIRPGLNADTNADDVARVAGNLVRDGIDALNLQWSIGDLKTPRPKKTKMEKADTSRITRHTARLIGTPVENLATKVSNLGKRSRKTFEKSMAKVPRELLRLRDTKEFAGIDDKPVIRTVWSNGKLVILDENGNIPAPPSKKAKSEPLETKKEEAEEKPEQATEAQAKKTRRNKKYLDRGLYAGQATPSDLTKGLSAAEQKKLAQTPELKNYGRSNKALPLPMFNGLRLLLSGRDFKLPFDVCNPLPPGQPKPDEFRKLTKNRFIGESHSLWKKTPHFLDQSKCVCKVEDGCGEDCQNRIMLYECDDKNCNVGREHCTNRAFADLQDRRVGGGKYRVGVEVIKTPDRGYGIRANRCFESNQIIMEYTGEIITDEECSERMENKYKNNKCYYLMSFDQNMIIDATKGSIARFVNHSCAPNCRMIKWIVSGQPRMALFAGDKPIMTGEELTYDYNFSPFSDENVQTCLCGAPNCRGILGPKPQEVKQPKPPKSTLKAVVKSAVKASKRKIETLVGNDGDNDGSAKKRKIKAAKGVRQSLSSTSLLTKAAAAKGAATVKRRVSAMAILSSTSKTKTNTPAKATKATAKKSTPNKIYTAPHPARKATAVRKSGSGKVLKTYGKGSPKTTSRAPSMTIVAAGAEDDDDAAPKKMSKLHRSLSKASRNALEELSMGSTIRLVSPELVNPEATITARQD
ncbi:SET domain-containing protein [Colletotrichum higginsianum]|uniref:SET domain-containing protein n=2 Tax=Colletotrichum higginsianum TaxID=80884 RepID=H1V0D8_COLHI|nr:SET domain-containing protein [Colletotrichum higginsianum IMI 349063]OBR05868.1 SET domain-containing protein [Colletotrichum higginsianum IMI 349063]TIC90759.1 Histone-lysine N-methyltransferase ASH1L [Colletotrichum higginsianum]CCF33689.1 SET domain-containing protein [Colletotrichum higginsianum]